MVPGSVRSSVICRARCSALGRDRPMVVMTLRLPRRSRMSQVRPGGWLRVLVEPAAISTVIGVMAGWSLPAWSVGGLLGCGQDREGPLGCEGKLL